MRAAAHHFKRMLLRTHQAGNAQADQLFERLQTFGYLEEPPGTRGERSPGQRPLRLWTKRTWQSWFSAHVEVPKVKKLELLDEIAGAAIRWKRPRDGASLHLGAGFYTALVQGGLLRAMLVRTKSRHVDFVLRDRAQQYVPLSAWHLHFDALEVCHHRSAFGTATANEVVEIAGERILELLHQMWRRQGGLIYPWLSSARQARWALADDGYKRRVIESMDRFHPRRAQDILFAQHTARPDWTRMGWLSDVPPLQAHLLLFGIGADARFLRDDHLSAWSLDLATAGLASSALRSARRRSLRRAMSAPESRIVMRPDSPFHRDSAPVGYPTSIRENHVIDALETLFLRDPSQDRQPNLFEVHQADLAADVEDAVRALPAEWQEDTAAIFRAARDAYMYEISQLGVSISDFGLMPRGLEVRRPYKRSG